MIDIKVRRRKWRNKKRVEFRYLLKELKNRPCADCKIKYDSCAMDFDHIDPSMKEMNIYKLSRLCNKARLLAEIKKCEVVCANCHRLRSKKQRESGMFYVGFKKADDTQLTFL